MGVSRGLWLGIGGGFRTRSSTISGPFRLLLFLLIQSVSLSATGCTSISWTDAEGTTHHLGLIAWEREEFSSGERLRVGSLGLDARLSGTSAGYSAGLRSMEVLTAPSRSMASADSLGLDILHSLHPEKDDAREGTVTRGLFYCSQAARQRVVAVNSWTAGFEVRTGNGEGGVGFGWNGLNRMVAGADGEDCVVLIVRAPGTGEVESVALWSPDPRGGSGNGGPGPPREDGQ